MLVASDGAIARARRAVAVMSGTDVGERVQCDDLSRGDMGRPGRYRPVLKSLGGVIALFVYKVFHTEHKKRHVDKWGDLNVFGENVQRLLGVYSTREAAERAIERMRPLSGFVDEPDCFFIDEDTVDEVGWSEGFIHG
jgi:hypothetical protein